MSARLLDGRAAARGIADEVRQAAAARQAAGLAVPTLAVVRVGDDPASVRYANQLQRSVVGAGLGFRLVALAAATQQPDLLASIDRLNDDPSVTGILLQLPLPAPLEINRVSEAISPAKDVDGVNPLNAGRLFLGHEPFFAPATPLGGLTLLQWAGVPVAGRRAVVVGRSGIVGRPLAMLLLRAHATVTICHSRTPDLAGITREADILAVAAGRPGLITGPMVSPGATVLDFGINDVAGKLVGDVDFASVEPVAGAITPVPGGTGPMTNTMLLRNLIQAMKQQERGGSDE